MAIVPVKPFAEAKTRLAEVLGPVERAQLARRLLERTLHKATHARGLARVVVISRDSEALQLARRRGAWSVVESHPGLNEALEQATRVCVANGARAVLILPADLPRLRVRDIEQIIALGEPAPCLVIAPAQHDGGTNALLVNPAGAIPYAFGENSFSQHCYLAEQRGLRVKIYSSDTVTLDLDRPEDLPQRAVVI